MKKLIELKLKVLARLILRKYKPKIVAITGSVGKTSTKEAVYPVLQKRFRVRKNIKNYNNELGLPLTIINARAQGKNIFGWFLVFFKAWGLIVWRDKNYPEILILEMGIDRPGDMDYLLRIVKPDIAIMTLLGTVHVEYFGSPAKLHQEKEKLTQALDRDGWAVFNFDNDQTRASANNYGRAKITYGMHKEAMVRAREIRFNFDNNESKKNLAGIKFKLAYKQEEVAVTIDKAISLPAIYACLAAASVGVVMGMTLTEIARALQKYIAPRGRMNLITGNKDTLIIDDTYNAEPESMKEALAVLAKIPGQRKLAVLGDMLELGKFSEEAHREIGQMIAKERIDKLIVVGERSRDIARAAEASGFLLDNIFQFPFAEEAGRFVEGRLRPGDVVLVKGSQGIRMEKIVKEIMAEPLRAPQLLVRQDENWLKN